MLNHNGQPPYTPAFPEMMDSLDDAQLSIYIRALEESICYLHKLLPLARDEARKRKNINRHLDKAEQGDI